CARAAPLGAIRPREKSNEITAIPELLNVLDVTGCIVTLDAMGSQKAIAHQIVEQKADYVLDLKQNHETLYAAVEQQCQAALHTAGGETKLQSYETEEQQHGRGTAFQGPRRRLNCTLLARWEDGYADPWLLLTDLAPSAGEACWYGLRAWIEQGFKITKRGGWQ